MNAPPHGAGREAGGRPLPGQAAARPRAPFAARLRAAGLAAPPWYAAAVLALAAFAAVALVGRPAGAGLAAAGAALCAAAGVDAARAGGAARPDGRDPWTAVLWVLAGALALMPALRAAAWARVPSLIGAGMLASLAAAGGRSGRQVVAGLLRWLAVLSLGPAAVVAPLGRSAGRADGSRVRPALRGGLLAAALLAVFVPLFTAADAAFAELVDRALPSAIEVDAPVGRAFALLLAAAVGGALAVARQRGPARAAAPGRARLARTEWLLPLGSLVALFAAFVAVQLAVLFGGHDHVLRTAGLSYADYAHQGYGQLMAASMLSLAVIAGARRWARTAGRGEERLLRTLLAVLCALCLVVLASALKRLGLYEQAYGSTRLRLLADANILWLGAVLALVLAAVATGRAAWLPRALVLVSALGAIAFCLANPDGRIASRNVDRHAQSGRLDLYYLGSLSPDAVPAVAELPPRLAACAAQPWRDELARPDGVLGANVGRAAARGALARLGNVCD